MDLLTRKEFRETVLERDQHRCVMCDSTLGDVAHHIMERRLFNDGGYYLGNGATVCGICHWLCEKTSYSVEKVREAAGITRPVLPEHLYSDQPYTKWGDPILPSGMRLKGELFEDESVQKVIVDYLHLYVDYVKYPRTYHLPWSENITDDDRVMTNPQQWFVGQDVVVTEKMDGENTTMYWDHIHARSLDGRSHPSQSWVKNFHHQIAHDIPRGWRICGENLYAVHSIHYEDLPTYFMGFSIWNDMNLCLPWKETLEWFELLGITPVPVLYRGEYSTANIMDRWKCHDTREMRENGIFPESEGYVVRNAGGFHYADFRHNVAKYVRKDHVQTVKHWLHGQRMEVNELAES